MKQELSKPRLFSKAGLKKEWNETKVLFRGFPAVVLAILVVATLLMNILAATELVSLSWLALDAGVFVSWLMFLLGDMVVKRFGTKAAIKISLFAMIFNIAFCLVITLIHAAAPNGLAYLGDYVASDWPAMNSFTGNEFSAAIPAAWWIILGSSFAFAVSAIIDAITHGAIKKVFKSKPNGIGAHIASAWGSTAIGQFIDNLVFAFCVSLWLFGWTPVQAIMCALTGMVVELICQVLFTPIGYKIAEKWRKQEVGKEYVDLVSAN